jgi:hypothetical protein
MSDVLSNDFGISAKKGKTFSDVDWVHRAIVTGGLEGLLKSGLKCRIPVRFRLEKKQKKQYKELYTGAYQAIIDFMDEKVLNEDELNMFSELHRVAYMCTYEYVSDGF